ncbi:MAG: DUF1549 and DUF1553 domain-containing protein [Verrucomicrobiales bacterium]
MSSFDSLARRFAVFAAGSLVWITVALAEDAAGRAGDDWWSLQPLTRPPLPEVSDATWVKNPIDRFILAKLEAKQLSPSPPADARTLSRRLYFDLIGLPPDADELKRAMGDIPGAIDALLGSSQYGERWARHWLDVARFGESNGFEYDQLRENAWPYRDWVIHALNDDMPYDRFVRLQIAGDVLEPDDADAVTATGFLVCGAFDGLQPQGDKMRRIMREDEMEDLVGTVSQTFLGLTMNCARCHDHKFDPIPQKEYFQMASALAGVHRGDRKLGKDERVAYAVTPQDAPVVHLLKRGSPFEPVEPVAPGGVAALRGIDPDFGIASDAPEGQRRKKLAEWMTQPDNPLLARVMVNRLWHYHFGQGLVKTPNDFGYSGGLPSHPELLEWLAVEFRASGWSLKAMHRLIVQSATYQQSSQLNQAALAVDADNTLLWRYRPSRLEAEVLRDSILKVAGQLNPAAGGPGFRDFNMYMHKGSWVYDAIDPEGPEFNRRSIYRTWARGSVHPVLATFDCPDPSATAPVRSVTTTPLGALALMNDSFVLRMADQFAKRVQAAEPANGSVQVANAYQTAYGRNPGPDELRASRAFVEKHGLPALCRVIFNSNEFVHVH